MTEIWNTLLIEPFANGLILFYKLTGNLGVAIILFTIAVRLILLPLSISGIKTAKKMKELAPQLARLKERHKDDKTKLAQAQMDLYKQHGVNPAAGCLPQVLQIVILYALFRFFYGAFVVGSGAIIDQVNKYLYTPLHFAAQDQLNTMFLYFDLTKPDTIQIQGIPFALPGILLLLAAMVQLLSSKMMLPIVQKAEKAATKTPQTTDDMMVAMQESMLWIFPFSTLLVGLAFPAGLVLYWFVFSLFQVFQQYFTTGWGGLTPWLHKANLVQLPHESTK